MPFLRSSWLATARRDLPWLVMVLIGGVAVAQSSLEGRDVPYVGFLEENGSPVSGERAVRIELFVSSSAPSACEAQTFPLVGVAEGRFQVVLEDLPDLCFSSGELFVEVAVGADDQSLTPLAGSGGARLRVGAVPFAAGAPRGSPFVVEDDLVLDGTTLRSDGSADFGGEVSAPSLTLTESGSGATLLRLETERPWELRQLGSGASADLFLENTSGGNRSFVLETDGSLQVRDQAGTPVMTVNATTRVITLNGVLDEGCPTVYPGTGAAIPFANRLVDMGRYCIAYDFDAETTKNLGSWHYYNQKCLERGLRLCTTTEVVGATTTSLATSAIRLYDRNTEGNYWTWTSSTGGHASPNPPPCHAQMNHNEGGEPLGDWHCQVGANETNPGIGGLCCY